MGKLTLITGGARSGKSSFALELASAHDGRRAFLATMAPFDEELRDRVSRHREERGAEWETFEEPLEVAASVRRLGGEYGVILLDCLTLWLSNLVYARRDTGAEIEALLSALRESYRPLYIVSNELGMGVVPENPLAREFRDMAGRLNQAVASVADEVYLTVSGIPVRIKPER